jgi:ribonuclease HI
VLSSRNLGLFGEILDHIPIIAETKKKKEKGNMQVENSSLPKITCSTKAVSISFIYLYLYLFFPFYFYYSYHYYKVNFLVRRFYSLNMGKNYYYAVHRGRNTGVYNTWNECKNEVSGYSKPVFKKFETYEEAQAFSNSGSSDNYNHSSNSSNSISSNNYSNSSNSISSNNYSNNYSNSYSKSYDKSYASTGTSSEGYNKRRRDKSPDNYSSSHMSNNSDEKPRIKAMKITKSTKSTKPSIPPVATKYDSKRDGRAKVVYTDGASSNNGKSNAKAGYGVYWGDNDSRNVSERLIGDRQTNQRAETMAIIRAVEQDIDSQETLEIRTDSQYAINALTDWSAKWQANGWMSNHKEVQNRDLFEKAIDVIEKRKGKVTFTHVAGHQGIKGNEEADRLAVHGATLPSKK